MGASDFRCAPIKSKTGERSSSRKSILLVSHGFLIGAHYLLGVYSIMIELSNQARLSLTRRLVSLLLISLGWCLPILSSHGHMLNMTRIEVNLGQDGTGSVTVIIDLGQSLMTPSDYWLATQAPREEQISLLQQPLAQLEQSLQFRVDDHRLQPVLKDWHIAASTLEAIHNPLTPQMAELRYEFTAVAGQEFTVALSDGLVVPWPCLVRLDIAGRSLPVSRLLTDGDRITQPVPLKAEVGMATHMVTGLVNHWVEIAPEMTWIAVGIQHIVPLGLDHMLFILGLFFLAGGWRVLLLQVTAFTIAHSITLGLSMYGYIQVPAEIVEPLIALSIVYVALDNLFATSLAKFRLIVVCLFGLLHGMGFASVLANIGLPEEQFLVALAMFNVGVELGQLSVLLAAFLLVGWFQRQTWYQSFIAHPATVAIAGTGAYWFLKRLAF